MHLTIKKIAVFIFFRLIIIRKFLVSKLTKKTKYNYNKIILYKSNLKSKMRIILIITALLLLASFHYFSTFSTADLTADC